MTNAFTQLVWKSSTHLNCGFATSEDLRRAYVVCQYWPKGNWIKRSLYYTEVGPPIGSGDEGGYVKIYLILIWTFLKILENSLPYGHENNANFHEVEIEVYIYNHSKQN